METVLPVEISNLVYLARATLRLKKVLRKYSLDYDKFCQFLIDYNAILTGSAALSCFDIEIHPRDLDIHMFHNKIIGHQYLINIINGLLVDKNIHIDDTSIPIKPFKHDIMSQKKFHGNAHRHNCTYNYRGVMYTLDILILNPSYLTEMNECREFDISKIHFNGKEWKLHLHGYESIEKFVFKKECTILNPFNTLFDAVYEHLPEEGSSVFDHVKRKLSSNKFVLPRVAIKDNMFEFYFKFSGYYTQGTSNHPNFISRSLDLWKCYVPKEQMLLDYKLLNFDSVHNNADKLDNLDVYNKIKNNIYHFDRVYIINHDHSLLDKIKKLLKEYKEQSNWNDIDYTSIEWNTFITQFIVLYKIYKGLYRIMYYISRGYIMTNLDQFFKINYDNF